MNVSSQARKSISSAFYSIIKYDEQLPTALFIMQELPLPRNAIQVEKKYEMGN